MANTYTQIHIQAVIATRLRKAQIDPIWERRLYEYLLGIIQSYHHKILAINGTPDHVLIHFGFRPNYALRDLMQQMKAYGLMISANPIGMTLFKSINSDPQ